MGVSSGCFIWWASSWLSMSASNLLVFCFCISAFFSSRLLPTGKVKLGVSNALFFPVNDGYSRGAGGAERRRRGDFCELVVIVWH